MIGLFAALAFVSSCSAFSLKNLVTFGDSYSDITMNGDGEYPTPSLTITCY
jgi:phospholipase/lecithinase/hemolysin